MNMYFDCLEISEDGKTLTGIKDKTINSVVIPDSIITIGFKAFAGCKNLSSVTIGKSVANISFSAFKECRPLKSIVFHCQKISYLGGCSVEEIVIGKEVMKISNGVFSNCRNLHSIVVMNDNVVYDSRDNSNAIIETATNELIAACVNSSIPHSVKSIGHHAFSHIDGLGIMNNSHIAIPDSVVEIGEAAFAWSDIVSINIPRSVNSIGASAFSNCAFLETVNLSDGIDEIKNHAFSHCDSLSSIIIPNIVVSISPNAFEYCSKLSSIIIPESVTFIGSFAFMGCTGLNEVHITNLEKWCKIEFVDSFSNPLYYAHHLVLNGDQIEKLSVPLSVQSIKDYTFEGCDDLSMLRIHKDVKEINLSAFNSCSSIEYFDVDKDNERFSSIDGVLYDKLHTELLRCPPKYNGDSYFVPESVETICDFAFNGCLLIESIVFTDRVTSIGYGAFLDCVSLKNITLGKSVDTIGALAFYGCKNLHTVKLPQGICTISDGMFHGCESLEVLNIPTSVIRIGEGAFVGCTSLCVKIPESVMQFGCIGQVGERWDSIFDGCKSVSRLLKTPEEKEFYSMPYKDDNRPDWTKPYSNDYKLLINGGWLGGFDVSDPKSDCRIMDDTEIVCECVCLGFNEDLAVIHVPASVQYIGMDAFECQSIIIDGRETFFCKNFWRSGDHGTIYVPCGTKEEYVQRLEGKEYDLHNMECHFQIVELSKIKVAAYLGNQKRILIDMISEKRPFSEHSLFTINDDEQKFFCVKAYDMFFITLKNPDVCYYLSSLNALGITFSELCEILGISTEIIPIEESFGRILAQNVYKEREDDIVDEDTGEVETITRKEILVGRRHNFDGQEIRIDDNDIEILRKEGIPSVCVYGTNTPLKYIHYYDSDYDFLPISNDSVIERLLLTDEKDEYKQKRFANKLACIYKDLVESGGCAGDLQDMLETFHEPCHIFTTEENNVINMINEFYDDKITSINNCETELDVMPLFTTDEETYYQLKHFLQKRKISKSIIFPYITQFFERLCGRIID